MLKLKSCLERSRESRTHVYKYFKTHVYKLVPKKARLPMLCGPQNWQTFYLFIYFRCKIFGKRPPQAQSWQTCPPTPLESGGLCSLFAQLFSIFCVCLCVALGVPLVLGSNCFWSFSVPAHSPAYHSFTVCPCSVCHHGLS